MTNLRTTNPELKKLIVFLRKQSAATRTEVWRGIAERLAKPRRRGTAVNLSRLNRYTEKSQTVIVPGKVLASGVLTHSLTVAAFAFSSKAREKIIAAKGKCVSFYDLAEKNPTGTGVKIIG